MKLRALLVICLLMPFAAFLANADEHIDNMCQIPASDGGWLGGCVEDNDWTAGWYVYRYGWTWTWDNRGWLQASLNKTVSLTKREVVHPPRGTAARSNKPLPTEKLRAGEITTSFPDGMKIIVQSDNLHIAVLPDGSTIKYDYTANEQTQVNGTTGESTKRPIK